MSFFFHQQLRHENLVNLIEVFRRKKRLFLVFEFVDHTVLDDLERYPNGLDELTVKKAMWQVLKAVEFCHSHNVRFRKVLLSRHFFLLIFIISYRPLSTNQLAVTREQCFQCCLMLFPSYAVYSLNFKINCKGKRKSGSNKATLILLMMCPVF